MKLRDSIIDAVEILCSDCAQKISNDRIKKKVKAWHLGLSNLSDEQIIYGLKKALSNNDGFLISCGQFKELCITPEGASSTEDQAITAWDKAYQNLNSYISPVFKDSAISEAIRKMGGWKHLCAMETKELPFRRKEFCDLYVIMKRRNKKYQPLLSGREKDNKFIGFTPGDDLDQVLIDVENFKSSESKMLEMIKK